MRQSKGFVLASEAETFGCVLMEAMACGCPVLTTRVGGIPAVVREGDGLFADVGNIEQIAAGMGRLLDGAHDLQLERISRETLERFGQATVGRMLHNLHALATQASLNADGVETTPSRTAHKVIG
jgi:glycosyltransferase involved in cell wall biosynthesis